MSKIVFLNGKELSGVTPVDNAFITGLMPHAPELAVKAYLYGLMLLSGERSADNDIAAALGCEDSDIRAAFAYWEAAGAVSVITEEPLQIRYLDIGSVVSGIASGTEYGALVESLRGVLGTRNLSGSELSRIYDWIELYGIEQDAAVEIVKHCLSVKGARTSVSYMDAVARTLAGKGILTLDAVRNHFADEALLKSGAAAILRRWHKRRPPTDDELALYEKWVHGWGFDNEIIGIACERVVAANEPNFKYLDTVLDDWHSKGGMTDSEADTVKAILKNEDITTEITRKAFDLAGLKSKPKFEQRSLIADYYNEKSFSEELILLAAELSSKSNYPFAVMKQILKEWYEHGISSVDEARACYERSQKTGSLRGSKANNRALNYMQGKKYSRDELKRLGISLGEDIYED